MTHRTGPGLFRLKHTVKPCPSAFLFSPPPSFLPPQTGFITHSGRAGGWWWCLSGIHATPAHSLNGRKSLAKSLNKTGPYPHRASVSTAGTSPASPPLPLPLPLHTNSDHVPLWDRLPALQVDPAPAHTLRHYFWHHRHRRHLRVGRGRGRQVPLRQYVDRVPGQERPVGQQVAHGELWVVCCFPTTTL